MPLLAATDSPRKHRMPVWALFLAVVAVPLLGLFGWSLHRPIMVEVGSVSFFAARMPGDVGREGLTLDSRAFSFSYNFPGKSDGSNKTCYLFRVIWL